MARATNTKHGTMDYQRLKTHCDSEENKFGSGRRTVRKIAADNSDLTHRISCVPSSKTKEQLTRASRHVQNVTQTCRQIFNRNPFHPTTQDPTRQTEQERNGPCNTWTARRLVCTDDLFAVEERQWSRHTSTKGSATCLQYEHLKH